MLIKRLKLSGFKSFVEPAELHIEPGLTGVVGPNGCGKSNLLEAIRWVMGENSPTSMRSGGMEDVIFAGTAQRPQHEFAEVVLQGETAAGEELDVTRRIERGVGSAFRVNGSDVRAKDVALTFADAATGAHSPALVSQGKIAQVIAAKPTQRRQMLEEAAGIAGLHVRRRDAENKLRQTETNLARLRDLLAGFDSQIASLRRQAKQAERYTKLTDQIAVAEARLLYARWRDAAAAADRAQAEAKQADKTVARAGQEAGEAQKEQHKAGAALPSAREELADRRDDSSAHGHRMATLTGKLEAAQQRLTDLDRQQVRLEEDRGEAGRMTRDAAGALGRLNAELAANRETLEKDEEARPALERAANNADRASRTAELALAQATADHAGVEAEWRVAEAEIAQAQSRLQRLDNETLRLEAARTALTEAGDPAAAIAEAQCQVTSAETASANLIQALESKRARKAALQERRDDAGSALAGARAELVGVEREVTALQRDRDARARQASAKHGLPIALDRVSAEPGYERALAALLGRDAKAALGAPDGNREGRFWTGRNAPEKVADSLTDHVTRYPQQLAARLALTHVVDRDDKRALGPGEWLVTLDGTLRRWDGFVARGEGTAEAARLEAENRLAQLEQQLPQLREANAVAEAKQAETAGELTELQRHLVASERAVHQAAEDERRALRALDQAESTRERHANRLEELDAAQTGLAGRHDHARADLEQTQARRSALPDPEAECAALDASRERNGAARTAMQAAAAALAAQEQAHAVARERVAAQTSDISGWEARSGESARRLAAMDARFGEIEQERAIVAAKPEALIREIEEGETIRQRLGSNLAAAELAVSAAQESANTSDAELAQATEALASARENRAGLAARAETEASRRSEMARLSGERFQCPPPLLAERFAFEAEAIEAAAQESEEMNRLNASRERIGPVNLVAGHELSRIEQEHGSSAAEQAELAEAVNRLRGSIGNLNHEGRERLKTAFEQVDTHFRRLFTRLFEGGQAHLALIDSDDPLDAGLEIYAQPPGKRLQSLTLLSGGEQALTAIALIFALFLTNPAPICVLDEVDAPLDDANIDRFCDLLEQMVAETTTRYLIVTHNAVTMSRMHRLFGVTMVEQGVSRLVSVNLVAAEELIAAE